MSEQEFSDFIASPFPPDKYSFIQWLNHTPAFKNVMHLRACKILSYLNISRWAPSVEYVRHEDVIVPSLSLPWLQRLIGKYGLKPSSAIQKGSDGKLALKPIVKYKAEEAAFDPEEVKMKSVWFNPLLLDQDPNLKIKVDLVLRNLVERVEQLSGYRDEQGRDVKGVIEEGLIGQRALKEVNHQLFEELCEK